MEWLAGGIGHWMAVIIVMAGVIVQLVKKIISIQKKKRNKVPAMH